MLKKKIKEHFVGSCFQTCDMSGPGTPASLQYTPISSTASKDKTFNTSGRSPLVAAVPVEYGIPRRLQTRT